MNVLIIGGVAAGTKTAAKLKRTDRSVNVTLLTKDRDISYAGCGLPYYVGGLIQGEEQLIVNTPAAYADLTGVQVKTGKEAIAVDAEAHTVTVRNIPDGAEEIYPYDKLVIAVGASPVKPNIPGIGHEGVFTVRTPADAVSIRGYLEKKAVRRAVVVGAGFIGLEMAENLKEQGVSVTVIDTADQLLPGLLDKEMAGFVKKQLAEKGVRVITGAPVEEIMGEQTVSGVKAGGSVIPCEMTVVSVGIRPNTAFLAGTGIETERGIILVDKQMRTNVADIYAAGDCAMVSNRLTGEAQWSPMGSSANMEGRTLAQILNGQEKSYPGVLGTGVVKLPRLNCGRTGLTEAQAKAAGYDVQTVVVVTDDKAHYYPDSDVFVTKLIAEKTSHKLLGVQVLGGGAVDKMIDIAVTGINMGAVLEDFENADYAYAPPFSTAIHPFVQAVYVLLNKLNGDLISMTPAEYAEGKAEGMRVIDVGTAPTVRGATYVELTKVNGPLEGIGREEPLLLVCNRGKRAYFLQNRLRAFGYTNTVVLEGATFFNEVRIKNISAKVTPEQMAQVKALGFLWDKTTPDHFNGRVITRNGKITAEESMVIAEAAKRYGSGEIAMTSRLTIEIQGVPYDNIDDLRAFLQQAGLDTGGTGSKVRPVVSCKGTTCQYGLIDTFDISNEIHERFYLGYRDVKLPHKFKIAVGGCPNNCVKPDLNDLGIIGQRVPEVDLAKCRGCKKCQVADACPIKIASVKDGKLQIPADQCNHCGRCVGKCPFKAVENYTNGYRIYIGGRWGKKVAHGIPLSKVFTDKEELMATIEKAILLFREQGITGERFADTIARIGFAEVEAQLLSDDLLQRKQENLSAVKHTKGGATC
ncbi:MAG: FAD-dependent oxidoreductase [Clostridia bacterium]|nr:FAD-dependent oxidoreductase [Clostridia bacterium]